MPAYQLYAADPQEIQKEKQRSTQLQKELQEYTSISESHKKKIHVFLLKAGIEHLADIDYFLRLQFQRYIQQNFTQNGQSGLLPAFDKIKQEATWKAQETLEGKRKFALKYENTLMFLKYFPDREIAEKYIGVKQEDYLIWDFRISSSENLKRQFFEGICEISREYRDNWERKISLEGLQCLYQVCIEKHTTDIERINLQTVQEFEERLKLNVTNVKNQKKMFASLSRLQKILFLSAKEIHWYADTWYLERIHISKERINPSKPIGHITFIDVLNQQNRELLKKYIKYLIAISDLAISSIYMKSMWLRSFMIFLDEQEIAVTEMTKEMFEKYVNRLLDKECAAKSFNGELLTIIQFYNFLLVRNEISYIPFRLEDYLQKQLEIHHDRSVEEKVSEEIISKLKYFPEHLRLMYLHLWAIGMRASEVCSLKGNAYSWDGQDAWIMVWQPKMRRFKKVPIPETLYRLMMVYIKKYGIESDDYLFPNRNGGAFCYDTLRSQMLRYCEQYQIQGGEYIFRSHDYRHTVATEFYDEGVALSSVRDYHGHVHDEMTLQYVDYMSKRVENAAEQVFKNPENNLAAELWKK